LSTPITLFEESTKEKYIIPAEDLRVHEIHCKRSQKTLFHLGEAGCIGGNLPDEVKIFISCMCMVIINVDVKDGIVNGAQGVIKAVTTMCDRVHTVWVAFREPSCGAELRKKSIIKYCTYPGISRTWTPITRINKEIQHGTNNTLFSRSQFPIIMRNASTIHKTQGNEFPEGIIDFNGKFDAGMAYVAISRFLNPRKLVLRNFDPSKIRANASVVTEMERMRATPLELNPPPMNACLSTTDSTRSIYFQNINGYHSKLKYLSALHGIENASCLCFVETHHEDITPTSFPSFKHMLHIPSKHAGIIVASKHPLTCILSFTNSGGPNINILLFTMNNTNKTTYVICYFAKCSIRRKIRALTHCFAKCTASQRVVLGDFNVNTTSPEYSTLLTFFTSHNCSQLVSNPTHLKGSTIDHFWTNIREPIPEVMVHETYFSDHFPLLARITPS
jgi:hypothetical protein